MNDGKRQVLWREGGILSLKWRCFAWLFGEFWVQSAFGIWVFREKAPTNPHMDRVLVACPMRFGCRTGLVCRKSAIFW
jgi:hypothetical protein